MLGRPYTLTIGAQAQTASKTLIEVAAPADSVVFLERAYIGQNSFDTSENLGAKVQRVTTTGTGTTTTARPVAVGDAAYGGTCKTNFTIEPTYDANGLLLQQGFNVLSGWQWTPANDDEVFAISPSLLAAVMLDVAPSGSMNFSYGATIREIGG